MFGAELVDEATIYGHIASIIENRKNNAASYANREVTLMYWEIGKYVSSVILYGERGKYGKQIVVTLAQQLREKYGSSFDYTNIHRMIQFANRFPDMEIVEPLAQQLSWSHIIALLPLKSDEAFIFYAYDAMSRKKRLFSAFITKPCIGKQKKNRKKNPVKQIKRNPTIWTCKTISSRKTFFLLRSF